MNTRNSIYDSLNSGRQRRQSSVEDLEATLGGIEAKLDRIRTRPEAGAPFRDDMAERMRRLSDDIGNYQRPTVPRTQPSVANLAHQIETARQQDTMTGNMASVVEELQQLRGEMRRIGSGQSGQSNDWNQAIRNEIEAIKHGLGSLAREDTLRSVESQWNQIAQRPAYDMAGDPVIEGMLQRIESIQHAVGGLPQSKTLTNLEEKIRVLASAIDQLSRRSPEVNGPQLMQIESRLDEISRAIVASSVSVQPSSTDKAAFERLEARLAGLNGRIEDLVNADHSADVNKRISLLADQLDKIASRAGAPVEQMTRMAGQMEAIATKIHELDSTKADPSAIASGLEDRLYEIAARLESNNEQTGRESRAIFAELENRLEEMSQRLNAPDETSNDYSEQILSAVEQRFADLSHQLSTKQTAPSIDPTFAMNIERRLEDITSRLNSTSAHLTSNDPAALERLERQVQNLASQLSAPQDFSQFEELNPRLAAIEKSLVANQDSILTAARQAAEDVIRSAQFSSSNSSDSQAALELANDLKALEVLARKSDERNTKTFEAIHDTLLKIVDRLNSVETTKTVAPAMIAAPASAPQAVAPSLTEEFNTVRQSTKLDLGEHAPAFDAPDMHGEQSYEDFEPTPIRSPAEAALAAARAAKDMAGELSTPVTAKTRGGFLSGLTKVLRREAPDADISLKLAGSNVPKAEPNWEEPVNVEAANKPIEPGNGTPDLGAIMKRVRDERKVKGDGTAVYEETAKSDFLAAARRAAQAAAADAEILRSKSTKTTKSSEGGIASLLQRQRKPIMMIAFAALLALTGLQLSKAFFGNSSNETAAITDTNEAPAKDLAAADVTAPAQAALEVEKTAEIDTAVRTVGAAETPIDAPVVAEIEAPKPDSVPELAQDTASIDASAPKLDTAPMTAPAATSDAKPMVDLPSAEVGPIALREAAAAGDSKAIFEIASRFAEGRTVTKDMKAAITWYQKAADAGFAPAQFRLGSFYEKGLGVERSAQKAKELYQLAAEQGNASAMHNLAVLHAMGASGPADNDSAAKWFVKAAEFGVKDSQYNLGILAAKGLGVPQNLEESYKWFALAAKAGDKDASSKRDEIANVLRPEQLAKARGTTELWKAKAVNAETNVVDVPDSWKADGGQTASTDPAAMSKAIRNIQAILNQNGFDAGAPDGKIGGKTTKAIMAYQKANGMPATGVVDETLIKSLLKKVKT